MRRLSHFCLFAISGLATAAMAEAPAPAAANVPSQSKSLVDLQSRFAKLQQVARPDNGPFELRLVNEGQPLLGQSDDGLVRLPEDWVTAAPDGETLDFLMLLGLAEAIRRPPEQFHLSTTAKVATGVLGYVGRTAAQIQARQPIASDLPNYAPYESGVTTESSLNPALRALYWAKANGGCEALIVAGLRSLADRDGRHRLDARQILKGLGAVAWTPDDRCGPPPG